MAWRSGANRINNWTVNVALASFPTLMAFCFTLLLLRPFVDDKYVVPPAGKAAVGIAITASFWLFALRALRRGVTVSEAGCTARFVFWTKRTPWRDVRRFFRDTEVRREDPDPAFKVLLERSDGRQRPMPLGAFSMRTADAAATWLNEQRRILDRSKA